MLRCPHCSRPHPDGSYYCFHDGRALTAAEGAVAAGLFATPLIFPSGRECGSFDELARACVEDWPAAVRLLREGRLAAFLAGVGRDDLAAEARRAATGPDVPSGLDELVRGWPIRPLPPPRLRVDGDRLDLGRLAVGEHGEFRIRLRNDGVGWLRGTVQSDVPWLAVGDGAGGSSRHVGFFDSTLVPIRIVGKALRASTRPVVGRLSLATTGGKAVIEVSAEVAPAAFSGGPLDGALTPRQLAERAQARPRAAAPFFQSGAVARWYGANGWTYPVTGPALTGLAAVQQFLDALGLATAVQPAVAARAAERPPPAAAPPVPRLRADGPASPARLWLLAVPLVVVALLFLVGTLIAVVTTRPTAEEPRATLVADGESPAGAEGTPGEEAPVVKTPVRPPRPLVVIRPREAERTGRPPLLLPEIEAREVEVVFCLDTTGSMGAVLEGAKAKIWALCNQIAGGKPTPALRVGLVAFRDRGDAYVTKVTDLSRDLDMVYLELNALAAEGGGDTPESVNQALDDAVNKVKWSGDKRTLRIIFLVGDAPPHMDYKDDVKYPQTCKKAVERGIIINTIQCGDDAECRRHWKEIAGQGRGAYVSVPQTGGVVTLNTEFDARLIEVGRKLFDTALPFGDAEQKRRGEAMLASARKLSGASGADRVAYAAKSKRIGPFDLLDAMRSRRAELDDFTSYELPARVKELKTDAERRAFVEAVARRRAGLYAEALELERKRAEVMAADLTKRGGVKDGFDSRVLEVLREQAKRFDIGY